METEGNLLQKMKNVFSDNEDKEKIAEEIIEKVLEGYEKGVLTRREMKMITNIFEYMDSDAKDIMTHRKNIVALDGEESLEKALTFMLEENKSRFPVYEEDIDNIVGILHIRDAMQSYLDGPARKKPVHDLKDAIRPAGFIPETKAIDKLFQQMQQDKSHMVIVLDEYGQTSGIVTMEDIVEEIVGNIQDEYDEEEKSLAKLGMTPEQAVWRRGKISESSLDAFHEEFPSTFEESCIVSGSSVFDNNKVIRLQQAIVQQNIKPLSLDKIVGIPQVLRPHVSNRNLKVWQIPKKGIRYVLGCDVAEGLGGKRDSSTIYVSDKDGVQVAEFKSNKVKPYEFADIIDAMGRWYNKGLLVVEKASGGHSCIERLRYDKKYMNMYKYKCYDEFKRTIWKVGFDTNNKTKSIAVNDMREWFDKGLIDIQSNDLLEEMKTFVAEDNGAFNAVVGSHDDLVSACWLCIAGMKSAFWYPF